MNIVGKLLIVICLLVVQANAVELLEYTVNTSVPITSEVD